MSSVKSYRHHWVWLKNRGTGFQVAKYRPLMQTEDIIVFCDGKLLYHPQMIKLQKPLKYTMAKSSNGTNPLGRFNRGEKIVYEKYPTNVIEIPKVSAPLHPTQKPVDLIKYLVKTYTNEGDTVLDFTMGSGTTGVACKLLNRNFIGIELDENYFKIAKERIENTVVPKRLF